MRQREAGQLQVFVQSVPVLGVSASSRSIADCASGSAGRLASGASARRHAENHRQPLGVRSRSSTR